MMKSEMLPKHKSDFESVIYLKRLDAEVLDQISYELLEWIQDINWPIAKEICEILIMLDGKLTSHLQKILNTGDLEWINNCLVFVVKFMSEDAITQLKGELGRIVSYPTPDEIDWELPQVSQEILGKLNNIG
jgi:hypothetical protein